LLLATAAAHAGATIEDTLSTCTQRNCESQRLQGRYQGRYQTDTFPIAAHVPFVVETFAQRGECLRLEVLSSTGDPEMAVIAGTAGVFYHDDDSGSAGNPLIRIEPTPATGWYVVAITDAGIPAEALVTLSIGRYPAGNPNCASPTPPAAAIPPDSRKPD
jgi:hypothetical protein